MPAIDPVQAQLNAIQLRLNTLDGQGLPARARGLVATLQADVLGLRKTLGQVNLGQQQAIDRLRREFESFRSTVASALGVPALSTPSVTAQNAGTTP